MTTKATDSANQPVTLDQLQDIQFRIESAMHALLGGQETLGLDPNTVLEIDQQIRAVSLN
ncbi:hypothetical protein [Limnohabitans sp. DM1]|uniref:hypothetical protein n=1 Tax=Limnohabitans sp. DM1 TaxID=1597955 RepID=UPI000AC28DF9|nr:hypothetical protein [Limnohabitans sp. DM1]